LRPYFQLENLEGINAEQYNKPLAEGTYEFCFEVYDWQSKRVISSKSCTGVYLQVNAPPLLNVPAKGEFVQNADPQNIIFQWTPRHVGISNVEYEFSLVEIWDTQVDPQTAFLTSPPLY